MRFSEEITKFLAWRRFQVKDVTASDTYKNLRIWCLCWKDPEIEQITLDMIVENLTLMKRLDYGDHALHDRTVALRNFLKYERKMGVNVLDSELVPIIQRGFKFPKVLAEEVYVQLIEAIPAKTTDKRHLRNRAAIKLLWDSGMRNKELLSLNIEDMDFDRKSAIIKTAKNRGSKPFRQVMWTEDTNEDLKAWLKERKRISDKGCYEPGDAIFMCVSGRNPGARMTTNAFGAVLRGYCRRAKLPPINAHAFRHHMGRDLAMKGANNTTISAVLGHSSINSSTIYTALDDRMLEEQYRKYKGN